MIKSRLGGVYETQQNLSLGRDVPWNVSTLVISYLSEITKDKNVGWVETFHGTSPRETQHQF